MKSVINKQYEEAKQAQIDFFFKIKREVEKNHCIDLIQKAMRDTKMLKGDKDVILTFLREVRNDLDKQR